MLQNDCDDLSLEDYALAIERESEERFLSVFSMMSQINGDPVAIEMRSAFGAWAFVIEEMSSADHQYRVQYFDTEGFFSHCHHVDKMTAFSEMIGGGYEIIDIGALSRVSSTELWGKGQIKSDLRMRFSRGEISFKEMMDGIKSI